MGQVFVKYPELRPGDCLVSPFTRLSKDPILKSNFWRFRRRGRLEIAMQIPKCSDVCRFGVDSRHPPATPCRPGRPAHSSLCLPGGCSSSLIAQTKSIISTVELPSAGVRPALRRGQREITFLTGKTRDLRGYIGALQLARWMVPFQSGSAEGSGMARPHPSPLPQEGEVAGPGEGTIVRVWDERR